MRKILQDYLIKWAQSCDINKTEIESSYKYHDLDIHQSAINISIPKEETIILKLTRNL